MPHSSQTRLASKTKAKALAGARSAETMPWKLGTTGHSPSLFFPIQDDLVESVGQRLAAGVGAGLIGARADSGLRELADGPVLTIGNVPEFNRILGLEVRLGDFGRMEMPFAGNIRTIHGTRPERVGHHVIRMQAQQQIRKDRIVINFAAFVCVKSGKVVAPQLTIFAHRFGASPELH